MVGLESATRIVETLVVLMAQNIGSVDILFLWMPGRASLRIVLVSATLENEADPTLENEATGS